MDICEKSTMAGVFAAASSSSVKTRSSKGTNTKPSKRPDMALPHSAKITCRIHLADTACIRTPSHTSSFRFRMLQLTVLGHSRCTSIRHPGKRTLRSSLLWDGPILDLVESLLAAATLPTPSERSSTSCFYIMRPSHLLREMSTTIIHTLSLP